MKKRPRRRSVKREQVVVHKSRSRTPKTRQVVDYVQETESESEEEIVQVRKPVVKQRIIQQEAKMQQIVVEEPQEKITKSAKETIKIPVKKMKQEVIKEEVNIETAEMKEEKRKLALQKEKIMRETQRRQ